MKIKFGAIVTDGRNKIGGHVASKNKAGNYLKTKSSPANPNTAFQSAVRSNFGSLAQSWRGLTQAQRDSWIQGAPNFPYTDIFGDTKQLSGFGLYMQLNSNLNSIGATLVESCPSPLSIDTVSITSSVYSVGASYEVAFAATPVPANHKLVISASRSLGDGRAFSKSAMRQIQVFAAAQASPCDIVAAYEDRFGEQGGEYGFYVGAHLVNTFTGQVSPMSVKMTTIS